MAFVTKSIHGEAVSCLAPGWCPGGRFPNKSQHPWGRPIAYHASCTNTRQQHLALMSSAQMVAV